MTQGGADWLDEPGWDENGLVPVIAQDAHSLRVLTMAWMNREALAKTADSGEAVYWSRSRKTPSSMGNANSMRRKKLRGSQSALVTNTCGWQAFSK